jgi:predicted phage terminase large subunit-like protein
MSKERSENILATLVGPKKPRADKARSDFGYFCQTYLPHYFSAEPAPYQRELIDIINNRSVSEQNHAVLLPFINDSYRGYLSPGPVKAIIDAEPREHGKSTRLSLAYPLYRLVTGQNRCIVIILNTQDMANEALASIRLELTDNEALIEDFGDLLDGGTSRADRLVLNTGCAIFAKGSGASVRGLKYRENRPDLIICDDIVKDAQAATLTQRDKIYNWFVKAVMPMGKNAFYVMVNTILHNDDLISRFFSRIGKGELEGWAGLRFGILTPAGTPLWPDYWTMAKVDEKRREIGSHAFASEYLNEPVSDEDRVFRPEWLRRYDFIDKNTLRVGMGIDSSVGKKQSADRSAIVVVGRDKDGRIYVLDEWAKVVSSDVFLKKIIEKYIAYRPKIINMEDYGFQTLYKEQLTKEAARFGVYLPMKGLNTGRIGKERVLKYEPAIENGLIFFKQTSELCGQLLDYPKAVHDDLQDAFYYACEAVTTGGPAIMRFFGAAGRPSTIDFLKNY